MEYKRKIESNKKRDEISEKAKILQDIKKRSILNLATTHEGRLFLYFMMKDCGFGETNLILNEERKVNLDALLINEALRRYYLGIRQFIPKDLLKEIEFLDIDQIVITQLKKEKKDDRTNGQ